MARMTRMGKSGREWRQVWRCLGRATSPRHRESCTAPPSSVKSAKSAVGLGNVHVYRLLLGSALPRVPILSPFRGRDAFHRVPVQPFPRRWTAPGRAKDFGPPLALPRRAFLAPPRNREASRFIGAPGFQKLPSGLGRMPKCANGCFDLFSGPAWGRPLVCRLGGPPALSGRSGRPGPHGRIGRKNRQTGSRNRPTAGYHHPQPPPPPGGGGGESHGPGLPGVAA